MERDDYMEEGKEDVKDYIDENVDLKEFKSRDELEKWLNEILFTEDSVTGNGSSSYTYNSYVAEENLCHNWGLLEEVLNEYCFIENPIEKGPEWCDVAIRCYLLPSAITDVLDEMELPY